MTDTQSPTQLPSEPQTSGGDKEQDPTEESIDNGLPNPYFEEPGGVMIEQYKLAETPASEPVIEHHSSTPLFD
jgi:hypothetical protein